MNALLEVSNCWVPSSFFFFPIFQLCEIDLSESLPPDALLPFMDEIKKREKQRKQVARKVSLAMNVIFGFDMKS